ncbi:MAG: hypothetical protein L0Y71_16545 [Gemmataceae bacterium]|nr:hypothetical protein [Gemmataceae bacterium]
MFFDTTSLYFEGQGGETLGQHGRSKNHRPDLHQLVVGAVLDGDGRPICCELWPGNTTDVTTLIPIVDRLWRQTRAAQRPVLGQPTLEALAAFVSYTKPTLQADGTFKATATAFEIVGFPTWVAWVEMQVYTDDKMTIGTSKDHKEFKVPPP